MKLKDNHCVTAVCTAATISSSLKTSITRKSFISVNGSAVLPSVDLELQAVQYRQLLAEMVLSEIQRLHVKLFTLYIYGTRNKHNPVRFNFFHIYFYSHETNIINLDNADESRFHRLF